MLIKQDYPEMSATLSLEAGESFQEHILLACIEHVSRDPAGIWNLFLLVTPEIANLNYRVLLGLDFQVAGTLSGDTKTIMKLKKVLRRSGDGGL